MRNGKEEKKLSKRGSEEDVREEGRRLLALTGYWPPEIRAMTGRLNEGFGEVDLIDRDMNFLEYTRRLFDIPSREKMVPTRTISETLGEMESAYGSIGEIQTEAAGADEETKDIAFKRYHWGILGFAVTAGTLGLGVAIFELCRRFASREPHDDLKIDPDFKEKAEPVFRAWMSLPDDEFWATMARAVDTGLKLDGKTEPFSIADQIAFMTMTIELCPAPRPFIWDSAADANSNARTILGYYDAGKKPSDIYRNVMKATYKGQPLMREIAARQIQLVLGWIVLGH